MRALVAAAIAILLAGCLSAPNLPSLFTPASSLKFDLPVATSTTSPGAEPVIAVAPDGTVYVEGVGGTVAFQGAGPAPQQRTNDNKVYRSDDGGKSWIDITPSAFGEQRSNDGYLTVGPDGTVYASNVFSLTLALYASKDKGATWTRLYVPPVPALMHRHWLAVVNGTMHLTMEAFPPSYAPYLISAPPSPSNASDKESGMWYTRSTDGGNSWSNPAQIDPIVNFAGQSNMVVSGDGNHLYVGRYQEASAPPQYTYQSGHWYMLASDDAGLTWERREMFDLTSEMSTAVPGLALDGHGKLWFAWSQVAPPGNSTIVQLATSSDGGKNWSAPWSPVGHNGTQAMAWARAAPDGHIGLMWYESADNATGPASKVNTSWYVHYAEIRDGNVTAMTNVTPTSVHEGNICAKGPACGPGEDRRLLDYPWMDFDSKGAVYLVFPSTKWTNPGAFAVVAHQRI